MLFKLKTILGGPFVHSRAASFQNRHTDSRFDGGVVVGLIGALQNPFPGEYCS